MSWLVRFLRFWYDFIVGDSAALAIGGIAVLVLAGVLVRSGAESLAAPLLPLLVGLTLAISLRWPR